MNESLIAFEEWAKAMQLREGSEKVWAWNAWEASALRRHQEIERLRAELAKAEAVAQAADALCARFGFAGVLWPDHPAVSALMNALAEWDPK
jgi:hypothetical protein